MANPIYKIKQRLSNNKDWGQEHDIGVLFSNVRDDNDPRLSLKTIMDSFLNNAQFIYQGSKEPSSKNVKVWYQTTKQEDIVE